MAEIRRLDRTPPPPVPHDSAEEASRGGSDESQPDGLSSNDVLESNPELSELDRLYQQALAAMEMVESGFDQMSDSLSPPDLSKGAEEARGAEEVAPPPGLASLGRPEFEPARGSPASPGRAVKPRPEAEGLIKASAGGGLAVHETPRVTPRQIVEAVLFVEGGAVTAKKMSSLISADFTVEQVESMIEELNLMYAADGRPYEVRLVEGGYRLALKSEFEPVRSRVFGLGPREVRLSQETLEILSLVAYRQPISGERIDEITRGRAGTVLRQLLRRELIALDRTGAGGKQVSYRTTPRFLQLFGLGQLDDLPLPDDLNYK